MENKSEMVMKILAVFESGLFMKLISIFEISLLALGLILGNIYIILLVVIVLIAISPVYYIKRNNLDEMLQGDNEITIDERTKMINEKAATMTFGIFVVVITYIGIIIVVLRDNYPQFLVAGYALFLAALFCIILYITSRVYYSRIY